MQRIQNLVKTCHKGLLILLPVLMLTACTGKQDIVMELDGQAGQEGIQAEEQNEMQAEASDIEPLTVVSENGYGSGQPVNSVETENPDVRIYVHICGAVTEPGVYVLKQGSRVFEGIEAAGGFREDACEDFINQAKPLQDGQRLVIPTVEEVEAAKKDGTYQELFAADAGGVEEGINTQDASSGNADGKVNLNTATESELSSVSGIGAGKAAAIVQYRQENGSFTAIEDIMKVSGIKEGTFEKIKDKITVN